MRHPEELEVVVAVDVGVEVGEHRVHPHRLLHGVQGEGRHHLQRHGRHDAERAQPDPGGLEHLGLLVC